MSYYTIPYHIIRIVHVIHIAHIIHITCSFMHAFTFFPSQLLSPFWIPGTLTLDPQYHYAAGHTASPRSLRASSHACLATEGRGRVVFASTRTAAPGYPGAILSPEKFQIGIGGARLGDLKLCGKKNMFMMGKGSLTGVFWKI